MKIQKRTAIIIAAVVLIIAVVLMVLGFMNDDKVTPEANNPTPSFSSVPFDEQTLEPVTPTENPVVEEVTEKPTAEPSDVPKEGIPPAIAPELEPIDNEGLSYSKAMEAYITEEEKTARTRIYEVIATVNNAASFKYDNSHGARDELLKRGLITQHMAETNFNPQFSEHQKAVNNAKFTVQTTGLTCAMRGQTPQTALEMGEVTCYYTRHYVDEDGQPVSLSEYEKKVGVAGAIDADQIARVVVDVQKEGNDWKVDDIQFEIR